MMKVFNTRALSQNSRFNRALLVGMSSSIILGIVYGYIVRILPIRFSIIYLGIGWLIGDLIQKYGRGVQNRFSVLAAVCAIFSFLIADAVTYVGLAFFLWPQVISMVVVNSLSSMSGLLHLLFIAGGAYFAYQQGRIL